MNTNPTLRRVEISDGENPYVSTYVHDELWPLVSEIYSQIEVQDPAFVESGLSPICKLPSTQAEVPMWLALSMYASRAAQATGWRDSDFDALLLGQDVSGGAREQAAAVRRLLTEHGDILRRIECYENVMYVSSVGASAGGVVTAAMSLSLFTIQRSLVAVPPATDLLAYELSGWCTWMIGLGGLGAGLWSAIHTWSRADNAESVARKSISYVRGLAE